MHSYFRNHQLYLAEKCTWLDHQIEKSSKRAIMKIESLKIIAQGEDVGQTELVKKLVNDSLLTQIHNRILLQKEGFYQSNLEN
jgi:ribosomal protein S3AE